MKRISINKAYRFDDGHRSIWWILHLNQVPKSSNPILFISDFWQGYEAIILPGKSAGINSCRSFCTKHFYFFGQKCIIPCDGLASVTPWLATHGGFRSSYKSTLKRVSPVQRTIVSIKTFPCCSRQKKNNTGNHGNAHFRDDRWNGGISWWWRRLWKYTFHYLITWQKRRQSIFPWNVLITTLIWKYSEINFKLLGKGSLKWSIISGR